MKKNKKTHFPILVEQDEDNFYIVSCPTFKGCHSYGSTIEEAMNNIQEVIEICVEEQKSEQINRFVGFRELALNIA